MTAPLEILKSCRNANGIWGYQSDQGAIEPTCLALLALRRETGTEIATAVQRLENLQNADGSWSAFAGDEAAGCWTTALTLLTLLAIGGRPSALASAIHWLVDAKGRESKWFWRWKFETVDRSVQFDPAKYGWSWVLATTSWIIPTAFSLIALRQSRSHGLNKTAELEDRIAIGSSMLLDRMCPGGGWNAGNKSAFGVGYSAYIDATAIALLALGGHEHEPGVRNSLAWLANRLPGCPSPYSLAWGILALAAYRAVSREAAKTLVSTSDKLAALAEKARGAGDPCTVALCALAHEAAAGDNVFEVRG